ncbi:hypothetical protein VTO42DRAFT_2238 [Malbranchea cinnamomea]
METVNGVGVINQGNIRFGPVHQYVPPNQWGQQVVVNPPGQVIQIPAPLPAPPPQALPVPPPGAHSVNGPNYYMGTTQQIFIGQGGGPVQLAQPQPGAAIAIAHRGNAIPYRGATRAEIENGNNNGRVQAAIMNGAPQNARQGDQFFVRELDGTYSLRTIQDIVENLRPGQWFQSREGYPYFVRAGNIAN